VLRRFGATGSSPHSSALFSFAISYCGVPLQANPCREVQHFPKNPPRERCPGAEELEAFKRLCVKRFRDRQTALYVDLKRAIGLRLADMLTLHRSMIQPDGLRVDSGKRGKKQSTARIYTGRCRVITVMQTPRYSANGSGRSAPSI
jgi:hypothetical protein